MEVQVAAKHFIGALSRQDDLDAQGLDAPCQQVHGDSSPHLRFDVSGFQNKQLCPATKQRLILHISG